MYAPFDEHVKLRVGNPCAPVRGFFRFGLLALPVMMLLHSLYRRDVVFLREHPAESRRHRKFR